MQVFLLALLNILANLNGANVSPAEDCQHDRRHRERGAKVHTNEAKKKREEQRKGKRRRRIKGETQKRRRITRGERPSGR